MTDHLDIDRVPAVYPIPPDETPDMLAVQLADWFGVYECMVCNAEAAEEHALGCKCRVVWVIEMAERIRRAADYERALPVMRALDVANRGVAQR